MNGFAQAIFRRSVYRGSVILCPLYSKNHKDMATATRTVGIENLKFENKVFKSLPIDKDENNITRQVAGACFSKVDPTKVQNPKLVTHSPSALKLLELDEGEVETELFTEVFSGNKKLPGFETAAHCYCGHQFGMFSGQLGDGAAIYLGEVLTSQNERWELQLKGAGLTPYSRQGDGRKVLRSTIREFLCSEAIHHLGIPTTRAGSCITSDTKVVRDLHYDGNPILERATVLLRIAPTFIRFGSFEICKATDPETGRSGPSEGQTDVIKTLLDYTIETFYPQITAPHNEQRYKEFFEELCKRTAKLVAQWMTVGFCHGVLNTDNMSIVGLTIDYGPFAFMDGFDPGFICNGSDEGGRYAYNRQFPICRWNLEKLSEALDPIVSKEVTSPILDQYDDTYQRCYTDIMKRKLGLEQSLPDDNILINTFMSTMADNISDFTNSFRCLGRLPVDPKADTCYIKGVELPESWVPVLEYLCGQSSSLEEAKKLNQPRMQSQQLQMMIQVLQTNPEILDLLHRGREQLEQELKIREKLNKLKNLSDGEYNDSIKHRWLLWLHKYHERLLLDVKNIETEEELVEYNERRRRTMNSVNPRFVLRNYIAQNVIKAAEEGNYGPVRRLLESLQDPYTEPDREASSSTDQPPSTQEESYDCRPPEWALGLKMT